MVLDHIPKRAATVIITASFAHTHFFSDADLDMIDVFFIPQWFEYIIGKTERHYILDHLLSQVMIDVIDLLFRKSFAHKTIELPRRIEIGAEWFFHNDPVQHIP